MRKSTSRCGADDALRGVFIALAAIATATSVFLAVRHVGAGAIASSRAEVARVRKMASRDGMSGSVVGDAVSPTTVQQIHVRHGDHTSTVRLGPRSSEGAVREAIAMSVGIPVDRPFHLVDEAGVTTVVSASALVYGVTYTVRTYTEDHGTESRHSATSLGAVPPAAAAHSAAGGETGTAEALALRSKVARMTRDLEMLRASCRASMEAKSPVDATVNIDTGARIGGPMLSGKPAVLPRVVLASLGTGRYRGIAIAALESAAEHFGGDCEVSLHILTDDVEGVDPRYNAAHAPYREWPESGLSKFEDILNALQPVIEAADFFYFMDGDVRFNEDVHLADIAGDLVGVEHPFYPRNILGFCKPDAPPRDRGFCGYPYDRNPKSQIGIPEEHGRSFLKIEDKKRGDYWIVRSNAWYLQSAFWGGKSKPILNLLTDLRKRVDIDRSHGIYSQVVQDERYVNFYFWKHSNDSNITIRILPPSYLYPYNPHGFGDWITEHARPIIVHGTAKPGKMIMGESELRVRGTTQCLDLGAAPAADQIGVYGCHGAAHRGGSQGFIWLGGRLRIAYGKSDKPGDKTCVDGAGVAAGQPLVSRKCIEGAMSQQWLYSNTTGFLQNAETKLCLDTMRFDAEVYPDAARSRQQFVSLQPCGKSSKQALDITLVSLEESVKAVEESARSIDARRH